MDWMIGICFRMGLEYFLFSTTLRPDLGFTQSPIQPVAEVLSAKVQRSVMKVKTR